MPIILASTSIYRRKLLEQLGLSFSSQKPTFDEDSAQRNPNQSPQQWAEYLARSKAESLKGPQVTVIGGDQLVALDQQILGKPKNFENALKQLQSMRNRTHQLITAVCVISGEKQKTWSSITTLKMRNLSDEQIASYLRMDEPYDCAGAYKIEQHGVLLFESIQSPDWTGIQGLPLLDIIQTLTEFGYSLPQTK